MQARRASSPDGGIAGIDSVERRIVAAEAELAEKQRMVERAVADARFYDCKAQVGRFEAETTLRHTQCLQQLATEAKCEAEEARKKSDAMLLGCLFGIGIALISHGSAAPYALSGCAAGRLTAEAAAKRCGASNCINELSAADARALDELGWNELPQCGGLLGIEVWTPLESFLGGVVVRSSDLLSAAGLEAGDVIVRINDTRVHSVEHFDWAIRAYAGQDVEIQYARARHLYSGRAVIPRNGLRGSRTVSTVPWAEYYWGALVRWFDPGQAALAAELEGATILSLDNQAVRSRDELRDLLRYRRAGEVVALVFQPARASQAVTVQLTLTERGNRLGI